ncbi:hypothetical protein [Actinotignum sp. GS-2025c]|uniref:hypothetical protein n=1 Tax=Actinotignum sp. GS-2025c TaxID=3427276 RepID=UPI003F465B0C
MSQPTNTYPPLPPDLAYGYPTYDADIYMPEPARPKSRLVRALSWIRRHYRTGFLITGILGAVTAPFYMPDQYGPGWGIYFAFFYPVFGYQIYIHGIFFGILKGIMWTILFPFLIILMFTPLIAAAARNP